VFKYQHSEYCKLCWYLNTHFIEKIFTGRIMDGNWSLKNLLLVISIIMLLISSVI
jgi:hypothetical protein